MVYCLFLRFLAFRVFSKRVCLLLNVFFIICSSGSDISLIGSLCNLSFPVGRLIFCLFRSGFCSVDFNISRVALFLMLKID